MVVIELVSWILMAANFWIANHHSGDSPFEGVSAGACGLMLSIEC